MTDDRWEVGDFIRFAGEQETRWRLHQSNDPSYPHTAGYGPAERCVPQKGDIFEVLDINDERFVARPIKYPEDFYVRLNHRIAERNCINQGLMQNGLFFVPM
jgi:hypothetical protein